MIRESDVRDEIRQVWQLPLLVCVHRRTKHALDELVAVRPIAVEEPIRTDRLTQSFTRSYRRQRLDAHGTRPHLLTSPQHTARHFGHGVGQDATSHSTGNYECRVAGRQPDDRAEGRPCRVGPRRN